jgi:phosphate:Na+ symporter
VAPVIALEHTRMEISRMGGIALGNLRMAIRFFFEHSREDATVAEEMVETISYLKHEILSGMIEMRTSDLHPDDLDQMYRLTLAVSYIKRLSKHAENIVEYAEQFKDGRAELLPEEKEELRSLCELTLESVELGLHIFETQDYSRLSEEEELEERVDKFREKLIQNHISRIPNSVCVGRGGVLFCDMVSDLERCSDNAVSIATALNSSYS